MSRCDAGIRAVVEAANVTVCDISISSSPDAFLDDSGSDLRVCLFVRSCFLFSESGSLFLHLTQVNSQWSVCHLSKQIKMSSSNEPYLFCVTRLLRFYVQIPIWLFGTRQPFSEATGPLWVGYIAALPTCCWALIGGLEPTCYFY